MDLTGRTLLGKYEIEGLLGQGGMGAVWRARHALTGRKLAIKTLDESHLGNDAVVKRFGREARSASAVQHPGIVEVLDLDRTEDGIPFLVMEFLEGETLARRIERRGRLAQDELVRIGAMLLEALEAAHANGVIHRDLKPENIYVVPAGRRGEIVKILDFGISQKRDEIAQKLTVTGSVLGTPHYMSPEQAMGDSELDHRADLYAVGVVLYECAVGDVPFDAPNYNKLLRTILDQAPVPPRRRGAEISVEVEKLILWAMEKERDRRIGSAHDMLAWLEKAAAGQSPPYEPGSGGLAPAAPAAPPAGSLPKLRGAPSLSATLGDGDLSVAPASWRPAAIAKEPKSSFDDLGLDFAEPAASGGKFAEPAKSTGKLDDLEPGRDDSALELDESALRPPGRSSGSFAAVRSSQPPPVTGATPRAGDISGRYQAVPAEPVPAPTGKPTPWARYALFGALGLVLLAGAVIAVRSMLAPEDEEEPVVDTPADVPPDRPEQPVVRQPDFVSIQVEGLPPGARLRLDGLPAHAPLRMRRGGAHVLEITAPGYADRSISFEADESRSIPADLRPADR